MLRNSDGVQIGLVSLVPSDCENSGGAQSTFTSVSRNLDWIHSTMRENGDGPDSQQATSSSSPSSTKRPNMFGIPGLG